MIDWLFGKTVGWALGLLAFALLWPIYKSGFLIRQGLEYKKELRKVDEMRKTPGQGLSFQPSAEYFSIKNKSTLFIVLPLAGIVGLSAVLVIYISWPLALAGLAMAGFGFINVK